MRIVEAPEPDEDGEPVTTMVVDWQPVSAGDGAPVQPDPWQHCRRQDQKTDVLRLKRLLMSILAEKGVELPIPPNGPVVRMVKQAIVREHFFMHTPAEGTPEQIGHSRRQKFLDLAVQHSGEGVGTAAPTGLLLLRWQPRIGFNPIGGGGAEPGLRGSDGRDVAVTRLHVQPRLAVGDVSARQALILPVMKNQMLRPTTPTARRVRPPGENAPPGMG